MDFFHKNQKMIAAVVLLGAGLYFYLTFFKSPEGAPVIVEDTRVEEVGNEVLSLYNSLQSVTLDQSLFSYSLYRRLIDFSTPIPTPNPGRRNPFNSIGQE